ncbi:MAG: GNAT family N-acetyltransferase [Candidatus Hydrogenedentes bacterium]|nr:GNAT family N-acetyltransferase [Candidatus Hydrogenedentota bacterium]
MSAIDIQNIDTLPDNFLTFQTSISKRLNELYGEDAAQSFQANARHTLGEQLRRDNILAWAAVRENKQAVGLLSIALNGDRARVSLLYILPKYRAQKTEKLLINHAITVLKEVGVISVLCDTALGDDIKLEELPGLQAFPRIMMRMPAASLAIQNTCNKISSIPLQEKHINEVASCILHTYKNHPDGVLYQEIRKKNEAITMLEQVMQGIYGQSSPQWVRTLWMDQHCQGGIIGTRLFPKTVFVLQLFVHPHYQQQGKGKLLLTELAQKVEIECPGNMLVLCVSADNPAQHLYKRLGFQPFYNTTAYLWEK